MISGCYTALVTPFNNQLDIEYEKLCQLIAWQIDENIDGLVILGTTGERMALTESEEHAVMEYAIRTSAGKIPIVVGAGCNCTFKSVKRAKTAKQLGADGILAIVPYYNRPPFRGIVQHFEAIASVGLPVIAYHHPGRTGVALSIDELVLLSRIDGIVAIKEASGDLTFANDLIEAVDVPVLCGDDNLTLEMLKIGSKGTISVVSNVIPGKWSDMVRSALNSDWQKASKSEDEWKALVDALGLEVNPIGVKYALSALSKAGPHLRLPLCEPLETTKQQIQAALCLKVSS